MYCYEQMDIEKYNKERLKAKQNYKNLAQQCEEKGEPNPFSYLEDFGL